MPAIPALVLHRNVPHFTGDNELLQDCDSWLRSTFSVCQLLGISSDQHHEHQTYLAGEAQACARIGVVPVMQ